MTAKVFSRQQIINAWCMYDWANSAFATTILAAVLPVYYSQVAGATLPSAEVATAYWSLGLSVSLLLVAVVSPILGTVSDVMHNKKQFLALFTAVGIFGTGLLILVDYGDWLMASLLFVIARIGFTSANVFYDALLPHVAHGGEEQDRVSARGYALGYLGGGLLLAVNAAMIQVLPGTWGPRLSFLSVAIWWAVFSVPLLVRVAEPQAAVGMDGSSDESAASWANAVVVSLRRLLAVLKDMRHYKELFKYLIAFLIYNDAIGTIIGVASIYGAELGFEATQLVLALLLVQFVGIPFSLIFGRLPSQSAKWRPQFLAFIVYNLFTLPLVGMAAVRFLPRLGMGQVLGLGQILALIAIVEGVGVLFALGSGQLLFAKVVATFDTRRSIVLSLIIYIVIAVWGYFLQSVLEFWLLAWMVAIVQGGSQALSRSLYATLSPAAKSGEFFGLFGVMEKFSAIMGPLLFATAATLFGSSRPAILSLVLFFIVGAVLLYRVDIDAGIGLARAEDAAAGMPT
jgi:MFS transporter, UMF1 family